MKIVEIKLDKNNKNLGFCIATPFVVKKEDKVLVQDNDDLKVGTVIRSPIDIKKINADKVKLNKIFRIASPKDLEQAEKNDLLEQQAKDFCLQANQELKIAMNLFCVESKFDRSKIIFYFTAGGRVDFRELVKRLVKEFKTRIEMRQVGIRNYFKMCGGIGKCGREICCASFIENFDPISVKIAKEQGIFLNPSKISGICNRLMCCLIYENNTYQNMKKDMFPVGSLVQSPKGLASVMRLNPIRNSFIVKLEETGLEAEFEKDEIEHYTN